MSKINLHSVLEKLVNEDQKQAQKLLHQWFLETCGSIHKDLIENSLDEEVHVHVHQDGADDESVEMANENEIEENGDEPWEDGVGNWFKGTDQHGHPKPHDNSGVAETDDEETDENLSPISGIQNMHGDSAVDDVTDMDDDNIDVDDSEDADSTGLEDRVEDLEGELAALKAEFNSMLNSDSDDEEDSEDMLDGDDEEDKEETDDEDADDIDDEEEDDEEEDEIKAESEEEDDEEEDNNVTEAKDPCWKGYKQVGMKEKNGKKVPNCVPESVEESEDFSDLDESFELEKVNDPHLDGNKTVGSDNQRFNKNDRSPLPQNAPDKRVGGNAVEIRAEEYSGTDRQDAPAFQETPIRKNQVKKAADNQEAVGSRGPKDALLNREKEIYPDSGNNDSIIGSKNTKSLRGDFMKRS